ncbi:MAG TPA: hypothetical protein VLS90_12300 [Thermodesulfobacteriota bacterium]|nr:hypothetical protein [Thermodesulfobacteriota bacterium]
MRRLSLLLLLLLIGGCTWINVNPLPYAGGPVYPPTDPDRVEILTADPPRLFHRVGQINVDFTGSPPQDAVIGKIRKAAGKMGADAVVISGDILFPSRSWWSSVIDPNPDQVIMGTAIRYAR